MKLNVSIGKVDEVEKNSQRDNGKLEGVMEYFQKIKSLFVCTYFYFDVFVCFICHELLLHPRSLPFPLKVPKACVLKLNILYLIKTMLDFLDVQT